MATTVTFEVEPLTASFGALLHGIDLADDVSEAEYTALHDAVVRHGVVVLHDQQITDEQQLALGRRWGKLHVYPVFRLAGQDIPLEWVEDNEQSPPKATRWHTDLPWEPRPPKFGVLSAKVVRIPEGGPNGRTDCGRIGNRIPSIYSILHPKNMIHTADKLIGRGLLRRERLVICVR